MIGKLTLSENLPVYYDVYEDYNDDGSAKINTRNIALLQQYIVGIIATLE